MHEMEMKFASYLPAIVLFYQLKKNQKNYLVKITKGKWIYIELLANHDQKC